MDDLRELNLREASTEGAAPAILQSCTNFRPIFFCKICLSAAAELYIRGKKTPYGERHIS